MVCGERNASTTSFRRFRETVIHKIPLVLANSLHLNSSLSLWTYLAGDQVGVVLK